MVPEGTAPAKIILFGEHAVVYGKPAIAVPVSSLRARVSLMAEKKPGGGLHIFASDLKQDVYVTTLAPKSINSLELTVQLVLDYLGEPVPDLSLTIHSPIPVASGLGSGAAVATALARGLARAVGREIDEDSLNAIIYEIEKVHHGTPSGIDNTVIVYEKPVYFVRNQPIEILSIRHPFRLVIGDTGKSASTRVAVGDVRKLFDANPDRVQPILDNIEEISKCAHKIIEGEKVADLGDLMNQNHHYLQDLTVSSPELDRLVYAAREAGASGAKLSGGGRGGNMIALVTSETAPKVVEHLLQAGAVRVFETTVG